MKKDEISAQTKLEDISALAAAPRQKLQQLGAETLQDIADNLSRSRLKNTRRIGPKTFALITGLLEQAGLQLRDNVLSSSVELQEQVQQFSTDTELLRSQVQQWVRLNKPDIDLAWREHREGAYGDYLRAQMLALNEISANSVVKREFEHQLVRSLQRYQRQTRYAKSKEALMDGITAQGKVNRNRSRRYR
ncbi:hypothetical protein [Motiliproteus sp. MSK22-1]|uniref:hypothetical protein n=1 Tax=Motiliproteus sp. MSK22-1 TaxID=1897630 RepID=UPI000977FAAA|nr:hypothetical protein [Motiliproteus sp. MSK22-1]OMH38832.1 hypothetical protein BGP75_00180 [Motiliproteus sp. MSK22-1]